MDLRFFNRYHPQELGGAELALAFGRHETKEKLARKRFVVALILTIGFALYNFI